MSNVIKVGGSGGGSSSVIVPKTITQNGTYNASADSADGYNPVIVNVSGGDTLAIYEGKLDLNTGNITADSNYCYSDYFDAPNGNIMFDFGEVSSQSNVGLEMCEANGDHYNYWSANTRYRVADHATYYATAPKMRLAFKKQFLTSVIVKDLVSGKAYSISPVKIEEQ